MLDSYKSLVLNYSYEPLQFCSARPALIMVFGGRAEELDLINLSFEFSIILRFLLALESIAWCIVGTALNQVGENLFIQGKNFKALNPEEAKILLPEKRDDINKQTIP